MTHHARLSNDERDLVATEAARLVRATLDEASTGESATGHHRGRTGD